MPAKAMVLEQFEQPLALRGIETSPLGPGETLIRLLAAGVCGSDAHMWHGRDPRTPLPLILGHEGIGEVAASGGERRDVFGREVRPGDTVMFERGLTCGQCYFCVVRKQSYLCPHRRTYGISLSAAEPPYLNGCYAEYLHLRPGTHLIRVDEAVDPAVLVAACCSGATAANTVASAGLRGGDSVVVIGPGPLGLFCVALALDAGAGQVIAIGTRRSAPRLEVCRAFGAGETIIQDDLSADERAARVRELTRGVGAEVVLDCSGSVQACEDGLQLVAPGGSYLLPGVATPVGEARVPLFEALARRHVSLKGVWVSDTSHLWHAIRVVLSRRYPFELMVTHRFPLAQANEALQALESRRAIKAVLLPAG